MALVPFSTLDQNDIDIHQKYMFMALELAKKGRYTCDPNPMVGSIIVKYGQVIGTGFHRTAGEPHAEVNAIHNALRQHHDLRQADIYVTLEPCSHTGRTPPCCQALEQHQFKRIIVACQDPNPLVKGQGITQLAEKYTVIYGVLEAQALELNRAFIHRMITGKPFVHLKMGASLDGHTALQNGVSQWITGPCARADVHHIRLASSAVMTGRGTFQTDHPQLNARADVLGFEPERQPLRVILDRQLQCLRQLQQQRQQVPQPTQRTLLVGSQTQCNQDLLESDASLTQSQAAIRIQLLPEKNDLIDIGHLLTHLGNTGINSLMIEAGPKLAGQLLQHNAVDQITLYLAPHFLGPQAKALFDLPELSALPERNAWQFHHVELIGPALDHDLKVVLRPGAGVQPQ